MTNLLLADSANKAHCEQLAQQWQLSLIDEPISDQIALQFQQDKLSLQLFANKAPGAICVDFVTGASAHRRKYGGGRGQAIAKAVGLKPGITPSILDATAGLGRDSFVLATLGCQVTLVERSNVIAALLSDGLKRGLESNEVRDIIQRMQLVHDSAHHYLSSSREKVDVVYLDPMFPHRDKSAQVKKEMKLLQQLLGQDDDADALLPLALAKASFRVVVKRPSKAPYLNQQTPTYSLTGKANRFDIYVNQSIEKKKSDE